MGRSRRPTSSPDYRFRHKHGAESVDRISALPDSILGNILSFLPTENAVATSLLSKRWSFLWTTVSNLDFNFEQGGYVDEDQFVQSVNHVLLLHKPAGGFFNKFSLTWDTDYSPFHVNTWIRTAVAKDVHDLDFNVGMCEIPIHVQSSLFNHEKLKSLKMRCSIVISTDIVVSLPRLENLWLGTVSFQSEEAFSKLLAGCPVLRRLFILNIRGGVAFKFMISSTSLKRLELYTFATDSSALCSVELDAPSLDYIMISGMHCILVKGSLDFLSEADIHLLTFEQGSIVPNYNNSIVEAIQALSQARTLHFSGEVMQALSGATIKMQIRFNRLTKLVVHLYVCKNYWSSIQNFMELSDNLEVLEVHKHEDHYAYEGPSYWTKPSVVPRCLSSSLKTVFFSAYNGDPDELAMVEYFAKHGSVLIATHIRFGDTFRSVSYKKYELAQLISTLPRKACIFEQVQFASRDRTLIPVIHNDALKLSDMMKKSRSVSLVDAEDFDVEGLDVEGLEFKIAMKKATR